MMATMVRLDFIVDDDDNDRTTLCRTMPAPLQRIVHQDTYNEFCTNVDDVLSKMCTNKKKIHTIARILMDIYISVLVVDISLYLVRDHEYPYFPTIPFMYAYFVLLYLIQVVSYFGRSHQKQLNQIENLCADMTTRHTHFNASFHLKYKEIENDNDSKPIHISHIEVHIILAALSPTNLGIVQILPGPSKEEPVRIDLTYPPILDGYVGRDAYATFCVRMETILVQLYAAKKRPGNVGWYQLGLAVALIIVPLAFGFLKNCAFILVGLAFVVRCYCHYQIYEYESKRRKGMKSKNDIVKEIHEILHNEMSRIHPNVSFHIPRLTHVPLTDICNSWDISRLHNLHIIHIYVITSNTELSNDEHTVYTIETTTTTTDTDIDTDIDDDDDDDDDNDGHNVIP